MTVCIAAMSKPLGIIVTATDMMLADATSHKDGADIKTAILVNNRPGATWFCLHAGKPRVYGDLTAHIRASIASRKDCNWSHSDMIEFVERAYDSVISRRIEREVLSQQYGIDFKEFHQLQASNSGALIDHIGKEIRDAHTTIINEMLYQEVTQLLLGGFDSNGEPHIFSSDGRGDCTPRDTYDFHAIGAGGEAAAAWLLANSESLFAERVSDFVYRVCEAKFIAENSPFVGAKTLISLWFSNGESIPMLFGRPSRDGRAARLREAWKARLDGPPKAEAITEIENYIRGMSVIARQPIYLTLEEKNELQRKNQPPTA